MAILQWVVGAALLARAAHAAFGLTTTANSYRVDTDGGLIFEVSR